MKTEARSKTELMGTLLIPLRGTRYCEALLLDGEHARLIRERDNSHDGEAIRVENSGGVKVGYVPRRITAWLGPLLDAGQVALSAQGQGQDARTPAEMLAIEVRLGARGAAMLKPTAPQDALQALHQVVLHAWLQASNWEDATLVQQVAEGLQIFEGRPLLPETRLLLALLPGRAETLRWKKAEGALHHAQQALHGLEWGEVLHHHNLSLFPLFVSTDGAAPYVLLSDALALGRAEVREVSAAGSVPELRLHNHADQPVLVPEGALLVGAKQNRVVNITLLAPSQQETVIPVSCVEQGRWHSVSETFAAQQFAPPQLRANKLASVSRNRNGRARHSDQGKVWEDVAACLHDVEARSETDSLTAAFAHTRERRRGYGDALRIPKGAAGALVMSGGRVLGLDLFDCARSFQTLWPRIADGYYLEASRSEEACEAAQLAQAQAFVDRVAVALRPAPQTVGLGSEFEVAGRGLSGAALVYEDRLCHLAAFGVSA